jgi:hypothetical protein
MGSILDLKKKFEKFRNDLSNLKDSVVTINPDENGMIDRECPKDNCRSHFKVHADDWKYIVKDEEVFCPFCRNNSKAQDYLPVEQKRILVANVRRSIVASWKYGNSIVSNIAPLTSSEKFELDIQCEKCKVRFAVIGAAYFCPSCGYNSIEKTALASIEKILLKAQKIEIIRDSLEVSLSKDEAAVITKNILEKSVSDYIGTLQAFSEVKYKQLSKSDPPFNIFQNVEKSNHLWLKLSGQGYQTWLTALELNQLIVFTQQRHLLEHKGGMVDAKYLTVSNDQNYIVGQRLIIKKDDVVKLGNLILKIISSINNLSNSQ